MRSEESRRKSKQYIGVRHPDGYAQVFVDENGQRRRLPTVRHFDRGDIDWGPTGSPCANLALSILVDAFGDLGEEPTYEQIQESRYLRMEPPFTNRIISWLPPDWHGSKRRPLSWVLDADDVVVLALAYEARTQARPGSWSTSPAEVASTEAEIVRVESEIKRKVIAQRPCPGCRGNGAVRECPNCHGYASFLCSCRGTGMNPNESGECPLCHGKGYEWI